MPYPEINLDAPFYRIIFHRKDTCWDTSNCYTCRNTWSVTHMMHIYIYIYICICICIYNAPFWVLFLKISLRKCRHNRIEPFQSLIKNLIRKLIFVSFLFFFNWAFSLCTQISILVSKIPSVRQYWLGLYYGKGFCVRCSSLP